MLTWCDTGKETSTAGTNNRIHGRHMQERIPTFFLQTASRLCYVLVNDWVMRCFDRKQEGKRHWDRLKLGRKSKNKDRNTYNICDTYF